MEISAQNDDLRDLDIAIIGMDCQVPGADNVMKYWENLCNGTESLTFFTDEELRAAGIPEELLTNPEYRKCGFKINDIEQFDAAFFGFTPREAALMDPQQRILLESSWRLMESAGYQSDQYAGKVGVFVGTGTSKYLLKNIMSSMDLDSTPEIRQIWIGNDVHYASTMISYKLNLKGPSVNVQTACSTSLTAVVLGCQALLNYQCDMAIAGGSSLSLPQDSGYLYIKGEVLAEDGHCRPFDKDCSGSLSGSGVGTVLLKRLEDAVNDRDHIIAVIKGAAFNNDGSAKVGYSAPSIEGERNAIKSAQILSEIDEETITYIETHGTATPMGDPIEVQALTEAFSEATDKRNFCALGAVKANIGHLDSAAGTAGLIKTSLMLQKQKLVPCINYKETNPNIDLKNSPFYVNTRLSDWNPDCRVRRAGVSSFGIGGTNVHVVLEEAIDTRKVESHEQFQLLLLSAKTKTAYEEVAGQLLDFVQNNEDIDYRNILYTMNIGRKRLPYRGGLVCNSREDLIHKLGGSLPAVKSPNENEKEIVFLFPGQGVQYVNMTKQLYDTKPIFRHELDKCFEILQKQCNYDLRQLVFADQADAKGEETLTETRNTQVALFAVEYCLAKTLMHWGITPKALLGHSVGEYVAACLAGVFSLQDGLRLMVMRGRIIQSLPAGEMLYVNMNEQEAQAYISGKVSLALINSENRVVLAGDSAALQEVVEQITEQREYRILHTSHAFHSYMMQGAVEEMLKVLQTVTFNKPMIPIMSNVTGEWLKPEEAMSADYWIQHMLGTVRFKDASLHLAQKNYKYFIEVGPGKTLSVFMQDNLKDYAECLLFQTVRGVKNTMNDNKFLAEFVKKAWISGLTIDFAKYYEDEVLFRTPLPTYPFERKRHWIEAGKQKAYEAAGSNDWDRELSADSAVEADTIEYNRPDISVEYEQPDNAIEESIVEILQDIMGITPIGINDNFFELGGHSLMITQVVLRIKELYGIELQLKLFIEAPTVKNVADLVLEELSESLDLDAV